MSSAAVGTHSGAGPLSLMSCVRESSPLQDFDSDTEKSVASKRKFWNPRKWFKRKNKASGDDVVVVEVTEIGKDALRSRSTSELSVTEEGRRRSSSSMHPGLSVSHDSVFHSPNSGSDMELDNAQSSSSLSISQPLGDLRLQTELTERLRLRRGRGDTSEDDEGLPHSPCNSPTASDGLLVDKTAIKDLPTKSHSTCSDGSLLSMGSYEDVESYEQHSRHSSKLSLQEKKPNQDSYVEFTLRSTGTPLNHSAAHHRVSLKPKRTHGAPKRKKSQTLSKVLPVTPEVNEESSIRSMSPEINKKESLIELYSVSSTKTLTETQLKCSSLPPGLSAPGAESNRLNRSKSNAGSKSQDLFSKLPEDNDEKEEKLSLLDRIFPRKSSRKKKKGDKEFKNEGVVKESKEKESEITKHETISSKHETTETDWVRSYTEITTRKMETSKPIPAPRSGPASRQRVLPMDIIETHEEVKKESIVLPKSSPEKNSLESTSPLQVELENRFKQRQISLSTSPSSPTAKTLENFTTPLSPRSPIALRNSKNPNLPTVISSKYDYSQVSRSSTTTKYTETKTKSEEFKHKLKMPGLSSLQQRVLSLNEDDSENSFRSLTELQCEHKPLRPISKSHSFKTVKQTERKADNIKTETQDFLNKEKDISKITFTKAASLDSVKNLDDPMHLSEVKIELKKKPDIIIKTEQKVIESSEPTITISGPSHTAVVNVTSNVDDFSSLSKKQTSEHVDGSTTISIKEQQVSVTKIQVKRESTQVTQSTVSVPKASVPEFLNKQLNKVEIKPSNIILSMKSPKIIEDQNRPKTLFNFDIDSDVAAKPPTPKKFSRENIEIIEKEDPTPSPKTPPILSVSSPRFKKSEGSNSRKSSIVSITPESPVRERPSIRRKSSSLSSLNDSDKSSQDSLEKLDEKPKDKDSSVGESVILRRKSVASRKKDDEPELMKVFARRSLKLKDSDIDALQESIKDTKTRDSDKENQGDSPLDERKKIFSKLEAETERPKTDKLKTEVKPEESVKEPLAETKEADKGQNSSPVVLRRTQNNNLFAGQRAVTINPSKTSDFIIKKQTNFSEHRKTDQWISNMKNEEVELKEKIVQEDILNNISPSGDFIMESKNFSQRKAEWEKRAQQAKKPSP